MTTLRPNSRILTLTILAMISMMILGCATKTTSMGLSPEKLGKIGAEINQNPDQANQILSKHDLTEKEFEKAIREVSSDAEMSKRYHKAFREALNS
ncbi:MAG: hypothetical protein ABEK50_07715 [bacterium]